MEISNFGVETSEQTLLLHYALILYAVQEKMRKRVYIFSRAPVTTVMNLRVS